MRSVVLLSFALIACNTGEPTPSKPASSPPASAAPAQTAAAPQAAPQPAAPLRLGEPITEKQVLLEDIAKNPKAYENKIVATSGTVFAVCQSMGCWMEIKDDTSEAHVKLAGHKFFVPKTSSGHKARVQAKVMKTDPGDECAKEAEEQTGKPVAKIELEATGVELD
jgi:hypothetical protein